MLVEMRVQFLDSIQIDDGRAVNARELFRVQACFQFIHRRAQQVSFATHVQLRRCRFTVLRITEEKGRREGLPPQSKML
jgi:hypothetical protein